MNSTSLLTDGSATPTGARRTSACPEGDLIRVTVKGARGAAGRLQPVSNPVAASPAAAAPIQPGTRIAGPDARASGSVPGQQEVQLLAGFHEDAVGCLEVGVVADLSHLAGGHGQLAQGEAQLPVCFGRAALGPRLEVPGFSRFDAPLVGQLVDPLALLVAPGDTALLLEELQRGVDGAGAGPPHAAAALLEAADELVAVGRTVQQGVEQGQADVAAAHPPPTGPGGPEVAPSAAPAGAPVLVTVPMGVVVDTPGPRWAGSEMVVVYSHEEIVQRYIVICLGKIGSRRKSGCYIPPGEVPPHGRGAPRRHSRATREPGARCHPARPTAPGAGGGQPEPHPPAPDGP